MATKEAEKTIPPKPPEVKKYEFRMNFSLRRIIIWSLILFLFLPELIFLLTKNSGIVEEIPLTTAIAEIKSGNVEKVEIRGDEIALFYPEENNVPKIKLSRKEEGSSFIETLQRAEVDPSKAKVEVSSMAFSNILAGFVSLVLPILAFGLLMIFLMRRRGGGDMMFGIGKSKAKLFAKGKQAIKFTDVAGVDEAKKELEEVVDFLKHPKKYRDLGARTPKGVLLVGPAGVGKTLLAKAVAGEAGVPFFSMAGSEFMEMLVGVGASRVRDLFETAKKAAPSIIFIDELDAIGRMRGVGIMGGHDERDQTLNQILVEMDGFTTNDNVIVLAATNRPDVLDPALIRPGRFDRRVVLDLPDIEGRKATMKIHAVGKPFARDLNWDKMAKRTVGFSGADIENMLNEAAIGAARGENKTISEADLEEAATRVKLGPEKKRLQSPREREMTAYHEAGHAVVGHLLPGADPVHRVSIVSRGMALGYTMSRPDTDKYQQTESELKDQIAVMQGGRAAEEVVYREKTGGASNDIERATRIARAMVTDFGMSKLGPISMSPMYESSDWGRAYGEPYKVSDQMQGKIDDEIKRLVDDGYKLAEKIVKDNRDKMDKLVETLLEAETVEQEEFEKIMGVKKAVPALETMIKHPASAK
ncbi:cell division protein FtsH [Candidatus Collierbacteria bacterium RIFCSPHIGHO2_02_FULL_49_10]|uniref:ATP-dependent zinc metalloprotease FtsH n=2 Tax=Candidatus Collieribacteriota TaxID=1752725 RepID=A0A1F5EW19_9BACT|nr:MAG: cell division protein FtsH [Candidatus Collierbacteria bacterium RIFCSPHIGHO2_02_FULL_49_10]OGD72479.1 MAG: cell division protein FtsH [Candidatus Collierbacteria bacterium RIFCSPHIGHO2_01_FULL_50_25]